jgi:hypothetical protein
MKTLHLLLSFLTITVCCHAQVSVFSDGSVVMCDSTTSSIKLRVGTNGFLSNSINKSALYASQKDISGSTNTGIMAESIVSQTSSTSSSAGVVGLGVGPNNGKNYGVLGSFAHYSSGSATNGAGVYGTIYPTAIQSLSGRYAAFFDGPTNIDGSLTATQYLSQSDIRLKENVSPICDVALGEKVLPNLMKMNVIKYNYKTSVSESFPLLGTNDSTPNEIDELHKADIEERSAKLHFGLSAQELQDIYPNLVDVGQDSYLTINYVELVPLLIQSIQELKNEIDMLKEIFGSSLKAKDMTRADTMTKSTNMNYLYQNTPNPFKEQTVIPFRLAGDVKSAAICLYDMTGKQIKRIPITKDMESVTIENHELGVGMFLYSLIVDGQEIDTKRMILK